MNESAPFRDGPRASAVKVVVEQWEDLVAAIVATTPLERDDAEDVLQDFTVDLLAGAIVISEEPESWLAYIRRAVRNRALNRRRDEERTERRVQESPPPDWLLPGRNSLNEGIAAREVFLDALTRLRRLPDHEREVFLFRYWDDLKPVDIAARTGLTTKQVDNRLQQAKERLAAMRAEHEGGRAYAWLALVLQRAPRSESSTGLTSSVTSGCASFAAVVAFSVVAATTGGGVPAVPGPDWPSRTSAAASGPSQRSRPGAAPGPLLSGRFVGERPGDSAGPARGPWARRLTPLAAPPACTGHVCVGVGPVGGRPGDTVSVTVAGREVHTTETVIPVCEHVPTTTTPAAETDCQRQETHDWIVKDVPPAPSHGGPP